MEGKTKGALGPRLIPVLPRSWSVAALAAELVHWFCFANEDLLGWARIAGDWCRNFGVGLVFGSGDEVLRTARWVRDSCEGIHRRDNALSQVGEVEG